LRRVAPSTDIPKSPVPHRRSEVERYVDVACNFAMPRAGNLKEPCGDSTNDLSNGGRPSPQSFFVPFVGTFDTRCNRAWWVQRYGPELEPRLRRHLKPTNKSWRVDETYARVKGRWCYLYRAIDSAGATIDFLLSAKRDADAAKRLLRKALRDRSRPQPRVIGTDLAPIVRAGSMGERD
jgi:hypothetical protein